MRSWERIIKATRRRRIKIEKIDLIDGRDV